ncbi:MAG: beta-lactamase family protein [Gemmatimonadetes bacterium]|nr:beta-lactamase family protein [Gemmatimonadota bacterium]
MSVTMTRARIRRAAPDAARGREPTVWCVALVTLLAGVPSQAAAQSVFPPDSAVRIMLEQRVKEGRAAGIVVGLLEADGTTRVFTAGTAGAGRILDRTSVFEIGSITKVFTSVLLADMVRRGEVALDDPVAKYLPAGVTVPSRNGKLITLELLATQHSGLSRLPTNLRVSSMLNPYAEYSVPQLYEFLSSYQLPRDPGAQFEYSNVGLGLLGHVLALRAGRSYEELLRERILQPLGMLHTAITLTPELRQRLVAGHNAMGDTVPPWDLPTLAGAGALRSDAHDMLAFASAALRGTGPAAEAIRFAMQPRAEAGNANTTIGLAWIRSGTQRDTIVWHNGGTGGFRTFLGLVPARGIAVVLLTNSGGVGSDDLGMHLLEPSIPLAAPRR